MLRRLREMAVLGVGQRFWYGGELEEAALPGGPSFRFGRRASSALRIVETRVEQQIRDLDDRVTALENVVHDGRETRRDETST